jgi:hypothetical protein
MGFKPEETTARLPSPEKSTYRNVGMAIFPVTVNPVYQEQPD